MSSLKIKTINRILPLARKFLDRVPCICISSIEGGALLITKNGAWFGSLPKVKIHSSVGAGDSMVGAMASLWSADRKTPEADLLRLWLAAACATLTEKGLTLGTRKTILKWKPKVLVRKL